jgi:biopolymer transport protein ExbD
MNFRRGRVREEPEINFIPLIDVLLVILIFLMVTTSYSRFAELHITLPTADASQAIEQNNQIQIAVTADGRYAINGTLLPVVDSETLARELQRAAGKHSDPILIINADAGATHQSVISVLEAARIAHFARITFATQTRSGH